MKYTKATIVPKDFEDMKAFDENRIMVPQEITTVQHRGTFNDKGLRLDPTYEWEIVEDSNGDIILLKLIPGAKYLDELRSSEPGFSPETERQITLLTKICNRSHKDVIELAIKYLYTES